ncbi:hypothetical protein KPH14_013103 [Odynerus spinipes]|uniref:Uncharacterized protein n=1 Tax=Odynerus spinipes TaxID=1348599 RepID=A0AAD9VHI5_9HYME|nr:hypothetical protein KPH14_013103 [Odynerus spinipes]
MILEVASIDVSGESRSKSENAKETRVNESTNDESTARLREDDGEITAEACGDRKIGTFRSLSYVLANPVSLTLREQNWCLTSQLAFGLNVIHVEIVAKDHDDAGLEDSTDRVNDKNPLEKLREFLGNRKMNAFESANKLSSVPRATRFMAYVGEIDTKTDIDHVWIRLARLSDKRSDANKEIYVIVHVLRDDRRDLRVRDAERAERELIEQLRRRFRDRKLNFVSYREHKNDIVILDNENAAFDRIATKENDERDKFYLLRKVEIGKLRRC